MASVEVREEASQFYSLVLGVVVLAVLLPSLPGKANKGSALLGGSISDKQTNLFRILVWISFAVNVLHFLVIDRDKLWNASGYQIMKDPEQMGFSAALLPLFLLPRLTGFVAITGMIVFLRKRDLLTSALSALAFAYSFLLSLAQNSRLAALYVLAALAANAMIGRRLFTIVNLALLSFSMITAVSVLKGRHDPMQGVEYALWQLFSFNVEGPDALGLFLNLNAGGLIAADSIITNANYPDRYKVLSFSPLPSLIDGFSDIRDQEERRINFFTPINAFGEVYLFGGAFIGVFLATIYLWVRSAAVASRLLGPRFSVVITLLGVLSAVSLQQYSLRTAYRFMLISIVVCYGAIFLAKRWRAQSPPSARGAGLAPRSVKASTQRIEG